MMRAVPTVMSGGVAQENICSNDETTTTLLGGSLICLLHLATTLDIDSASRICIEPLLLMDTVSRIEHSTSTTSFCFNR